MPLKKLWLLICFWTMSVHLLAQDEYLLNKWKEYHSAQTDTAKARILALLSGYYSEYDLDSAFALAYQGLALAQKHHHQELEISCKTSLAMAFSKMGANQQALEILLSNLRSAEAMGNEMWRISMLGSIAYIFSEMGDWDKALVSVNKLKQMPEVQANPSIMNNLYISLSDFFWRKGQQDSALHYNYKAYEKAEQTKSKDMACLVQNNFGNIYLSLKQPDLAIVYYKACLPHALLTNFTIVVCEAYMGLAKIFYEKQQSDSAFYYAKKSLSAAQRARYTKYILESSNLLVRFYQTAQRSDSSLKYLSIAMAARDTLYNQDKVNKIKVMEFQEMTREQERAAAAATKKEEQRQNIQYAIIALCVLGLLIMLFLLSRSFIVHHNFVRFLGVLSLLLLFEFINLIAHPYLITVTGHSPILMLLIMVGIASLMIPLHHRLERWVIGKLVEKNKRIRLEAAKKIVASLEEPAE